MTVYSTMGPGNYDDFKYKVNKAGLRREDVEILITARTVEYLAGFETAAKSIAARFKQDFEIINTNYDYGHKNPYHKFKIITNNKPSAPPPPHPLIGLVNNGGYAASINLYKTLMSLSIVNPIHIAPLYKRLRQIRDS